jgi:hypothetical protein
MESNWSMPWLNRMERVAIERGVASADLVSMLKVKHMAHRRVTLGQLSAGEVWLFYLPDFTQIFKDWYRLYIDAVKARYNPAAETNLYFGQDFVLLKYGGIRPRGVLERMLRHEDWEGIETLLKRCHQAEFECERQLLTLAADKSLAPQAVAKLVSSMTNFAAFGLDNIFPEDLLVRKFPFVDLSTVYFSRLSTWGLIHKRTLETLADHFAGTLTHDGSVERLAATAAYLGWGDIENPESDRLFAATLLTSYMKQYPNLAVLHESAEAEREGLRFSGSPALHYGQSIHKWRAGIDPSDLKLFDWLVRLAREAQEYNEKRRLLFTQSLRALRSYCEQEKLDCRHCQLVEVLTKKEVSHHDAT